MVTAVRPFTRPSILIRPIIMETAANTPMAIEKAIIVADTLAIWVSEATVETLIKALISRRNAPTKIIPFVISSGFSIPTSLHTPTNINNEKETDSNNPPIFAVPTSIPISVTAFVKLLINSKKAPMNTTPFSISLGFSIPISLTTPTSISNEKEMDNNNPPIFAVF